MKFLRLLLVLCLLPVLFSSCEKENTDDDDDGGGGGGTSGRFSTYTSCTIIAPPTGTNLNSVYKRYLNCSGIPVIGTDNVSDEGLLAADSIIAFLLKGQDNVKSRLVKKGLYFIVVAIGEDFNTFPEMTGENLPANAGAVYLYHKLAGITREETLLCYGHDGLETNNFTIHEFVHAMHLTALADLHSNFDNELQGLYNSARANGLWNNTYNAYDYREYLAVGVQIYYNSWYPYGTPGGNGYGNEINTRALLQTYDPQLYAFIERYFNHDARPPGCYYLEP